MIAKDDRSQQYQNRIHFFTEKAQMEAFRYKRYSWLRLTIFLLIILVVIFLFDLHWGFGLGGIFFLGLLFVRFIQWHQSIGRKEKHYLYLAGINRREDAVLQHQFGEFPDGKDFLDAGHQYALDLDIFGPFSFFQYTNRTSTYIGQKRLADWLMHPADTSSIKERQKGISCLSPQLDWRQEWQALGAETPDTPQHIDLLRHWLSRTNYLRPLSWIPYALVLLPCLTVGLFFYCLPFQPWYITILTLLPNALLLRKFTAQVNQTHQETTLAEAALARYAQLVKHVHKLDTTEASELATLKNILDLEASAAIRRLSYLITQLNVRYNAFALIFNIFGLWDLQWVYRLEKWKTQHQAQLPAWFDSLAEMEALISLATTAFNNPDWVFPVIDQAPYLRAQSIGHPLLPASTRVTNHLDMPTQGHIKLITGSNMAGKSTFLRTIGLNIVLARCGSVVCAEALQLPPLLVYTSMRTQDALHESTSSFYAELKRLQFIIEAVESKTHVFFLLDEILKGTNSRDRHTGSKALIQQLIHQGGGGLIATHDLELGSLESQYNGAIENLCMEVRIEGDQLLFDYKIHPGVSQSFNATLLMKNMGIKISDVHA